jgi:uncharacterized membrane protein
MISTVFAGVMAGFFFAYSASVTLALETFSAEAYTNAMQRINETVRNVAFGVAFFGAIVIPAVGAVVTLFQGHWTAQYGLLFFVGIAAYAIGTVAVTVLVHFPLRSSEADCWSNRAGAAKA